MVKSAEEQLADFEHTLVLHNVPDIVSMKQGIRAQFIAEGQTVDRQLDERINRAAYRASVVYVEDQLWNLTNQIPDNWSLAQAYARVLKEVAAVGATDEITLNRTASAQTSVNARQEYGMK